MMKLSEQMRRWTTNPDRRLFGEYEDQYEGALLDFADEVAHLETKLATHIALCVEQGKRIAEIEAELGRRVRLEFFEEIFFDEGGN